MESMEQRVSNNKQVRGGKERKEESQGKRKGSEKENGKNFQRKKIFFLFFLCGSRDKKSTNRGTNILRFDPKKRNDDGNAKYSSPIGQFWSRDPHPDI